MKKNRIFKVIIPAALAVLPFSCAKEATTGLNDASKRFFDSWLQLYHPDAQREGYGIYILDETVGKGAPISDISTFPYLYIDYTSTDLDGNVSETSDAKLARQIGTYDETSYFGPMVLLRSETNVSAGLEMMLDPMRVGGTRTAAIPGWLSGTQRYGSEEEYLKKASGTDVIYTITVKEGIPDIIQWQIDSMSRYMLRNFRSIPDSLKYGFYYIQTKAPSDTNSFDISTPVYANYTGSLLNGQVFDTNIENTAKDHGIYSSARTYEPLEITLAEEYSDYSFTSGTETGTFVDGFSYCLSRMRTGEKGICIFYSPSGYGTTASDNIPAYSPLKFEIEMLGTEAD